MKITTLPVYSKLVDDAASAVVRLSDRQPHNLYLSRHQVDTYNALRDPQIDVIINTAMTGDGKSLAGQLRTLVDKKPLLAMYPTNELIRDQMRQVDRALDNWALGQTINHMRLYSRTLDELMAGREFTGRGNALLSVLRNNEIVLTNPDIFHYIMQFYYTRKGDAPERLAAPLIDLFDVMVFDEFHIFDSPQVIAVLNALLFIHEVAGEVANKKFVFLSATPGELLVQYLTRAGLRHMVIRGQYQHSWSDPGLGWRRILHGTDIHFATGKAEDWIDAHLEDTMLAFFRAHRPGAKGAIIVNSVAAAKRLVPRLRAALRPEGLNVGENTGFTSDETRRLSYETDLLVGTSTIDVGVDFDINFLVFESRDAGSFLQRLGRLGRHNGYTRDGVRHAFHAFEAHALLPPFILERLFQDHEQTPAWLEAGSEVDRERLTEAIRAVFPQPTSFASYGRVWGGLQSMAVINGLSNPTIRDSFAGARERLAQRYETTFGIHLKGVYGRYKEWLQNKRAILEEARSFRGSSPFECGVIDMSERGAERLKTYDLFGLLANCRIERITEDEFYAEAARWQVDDGPFRRAKPLDYFRLYEFVPERQTVRVLVNQDVGLWSAIDLGKVRLVKGIEVDAIGVSGLNALNTHLARRELVALLCLCSPGELTRRLRLPIPFALYAFEARDRRDGSIAFGREALLLEVAIQEKRLECGGGLMIIGQ